MKNAATLGLRSALFLVISFCLVENSYSQVVLEQKDDRQLSRIGVEEKLGQFIPLHLTFTNDEGQVDTLGRYFHANKPVLLTLAYYECPMLCTMVLNGVSAGIQQIEWKPGDKFQMLTVSIDPAESAELAHRKKDNYLKALGEGVNPQGWRFFVGDSAQIRQLAAAVGFKYYYDADKDEFAHPAVVFLLTPDGKISRYLYGLEYKPQTLRLGLLEASAGRIGSTIDRLILFCYHYDPQAGSYVLFAQNVMRLGGIITIIGLAGFIALLWSRENFKKPA